MKPSTDVDNTLSSPFTLFRLYQSLLGSLSYLAQHSRPDIAVAVHTLSKHQCAPTVAHYRLAKKCVRYLYNTRSWEVFYASGGLSTRCLTVYCDSNFVRKADGKSVYGFVVYLNSHLIKWKTKKHTRVTRSTCVAELLGLLEAVRAVRGIMLLLEDLQLAVQDVDFYCDNKAAIDVVLSQKFSPAIKDCSLPELYLRQEFRTGRFKLKYVRSEDNPADLFTKNLEHPLFVKHRSFLMKSVQ